MPPHNNAMKLTRSAWANGRERPLQLISVLCGSVGSLWDRTGGGTASR